MKSICYIIPFFGRLPKSFPLFLKSCDFNPTVNWLIFTNNKDIYSHNKNVKIITIEFNEVKKMIQKIFSFPISLDNPRKLCDYKCSYGEAFHDFIKSFDFWGYCDIDMVFGNVRKFMTEKLLNSYEKIGFQGHSTLFHNTEENNSRYRIDTNNTISYKTVYSNPKGFCFDENIISKKFQDLSIPQYMGINFAHLEKYNSGFFLFYFPPIDDYKNKHQIFILKNGILNRYYLFNDIIFCEEFMYIHFWCRPMTYEKIKSNSFLIYSDNVKNIKDSFCVNKKNILHYSKNRKLIFYIKALFLNWNNISFKKIWFNIRHRHQLKKQGLN